MTWIIELLECVWKGLFPPKPKRLELRYVEYSEAEKLLRDRTAGWRLAIPEEGVAGAG